MTERQETAPGFSGPAPGILAVRSVHFAPFQVSIVTGPDPPCESPTATQLLAVRQDTPARDAKPLPLGAGGVAVGVSRARR